MDREVQNAVIDRTRLGREDHGIFTFTLELKAGAWGVGYGGVALDSYDRANDQRVGWHYGIDALSGVLATVGVDTWEELRGKYCRVAWYASWVCAIGNIIDDRWFAIVGKDHPKPITGTYRTVMDRIAEEEAIVDARKRRP